MDLLKLPKIKMKVPNPSTSNKNANDNSLTLPPIVSGTSATSSTQSWSRTSMSLFSDTSSHSAVLEESRQITPKKSRHVKKRKKESKLKVETPKKNLLAARRYTRAQSIDDQMNYNHLRRLEQIFNEGNRDGRGLDIEQFRIAMKKTMGSDVDDYELEMLFMKIDTNCDGTLDWSEYLSYMLLEYQEKKNMFNLDQDCPFPMPWSLKANCHTDSICSIRLLQAYTTRYNPHGLSEPDDAGSRWLTLSRDGVINIWDLDWIPQKTFSLDRVKKNIKDPGGNLLVTDMVCMPNCNTIAVASAAYEISFYTTMSSIIQKRFQIQDLRYCVLTMDYSYDVQDPQNAILIWGDTSGSIIIIRFDINPNLSLFSAPLCVNNKISMIRVLHGTLPGLRATLCRNIHTDWIRQVRYYKSSKGQECLLSCCIKPETALLFADITEKPNGKPQQEPQIIKKSHFYIKKGVLCHSYDPEWNLIATGSCDCDVRVWNPYVVEKSMVVLKGHTHAVLHVLIRTFDHQVISISKDRNVRIWDLRDYTCKQNINGRNIELGNGEITAAHFSNRHKELIIATSRLGVFHPRNPVMAGHKQQHYKTHQKSIIDVLYNPLFQQIVTSGEDSMISNWDIKTGLKKMQFFTGNDHEVTCMAFDPTYRRLVTGGRCGNTILWNFHNGERLRCFAKMDELEIVNVKFIKNRIMASSWNKHVCSYSDTYGNDVGDTFYQKHSDDILSMDVHNYGLILATSSYDGDIFLWSIEEETIIMTFNMHLSLHPICKLTEQFQGRSESAFKRKRSSYNPQKVEADVTKDFKTTGQKTYERRHGLKPDDIKTIPSYWLPISMPWLKQSQKETEISESVVEEKASALSNSSSTTSTKSSTSSETQLWNMTDKATYKVLFLQTRCIGPFIGSLLAAGCEGWISIWSIHQYGGMLGYFKACKKQSHGTIVTSMVTDHKNSLLVTGDNKGYIRTWDISNYCNEDILQKTSEEIDQCYSHREQLYHLPKDTPPNLRISVRAHLSAITSLAYVDPHGLVASGGIDGSVRLWTDNGRYIGTFGQHKSWDINLPVQIKDLPASIPYDVRRVASINTLCTAKGSSRNKWETVKTMQAAVSVLKQSKNKKRSKSFASKATLIEEALFPRESIEDQLATVEKNLLEESSLLVNKQARMRRESVTVWLQDKPHSIICPQTPIPSVQKTFERLKEGLTSNILGKINYKPKRRHKQPTIGSLRLRNKNPAIFGLLPFVEIYSPQIPKVPQVVQNHLINQQTNAANAASKRQHLHSSQRKGSTVVDTQKISGYY